MLFDLKSKYKAHLVLMVIVGADTTGRQNKIFTENEMIQRSSIHNMLSHLSQ